MDGSLLVVKLIAMMLNKKPNEVNELEILNKLLGLAKTEPMKVKL